MRKRNRPNRPSYYRARRLTVGMAEDMLKKIPDKSAVLMMADKNGQNPEPCLRGYHIIGPGGKSSPVPIGVVLCGKFSWTGGDEEEEIDPTEDMSEEDRMKIVCAYFDSQVTYEEGDCIVLERGIEYMGAPVR